MRKLILIIILLEVLIIAYLIVIFFQKQHKLSITPIQKDTIVTDSSSNLKNFYELKPNIEVTENTAWFSYTAIHTHNADSLNERFNYPIEKDGDTFRIITLGDSFTYGSHISTENIWPERLEDLLNNHIACTNISKFEVINLGVPGYDIEYSVERFKKRGQKYDPDLVIWFLIKNDFTQWNEVMKTPDIRKGIEEAVKLSAEIPLILQQIQKEKTAEIGEEKIIQHQTQALQSISQYFKKKLVIFTFPNIGEEYKTIIKNFVSERAGNYFYDVIPDLSLVNGLLEDNHPNIEGHELIAEDLLNYLLKEKIIPCN